MKKLAVLSSLLLCGIVATTQAQQFGEAGDTLSFVKITIKNIDDTPYANQKVVLRGEERGNVVEVNTDAKGFVRATVPFDDNYTVHCGSHKCLNKISISEFPYVTYDYQGFSSSGLILNFICKSNIDKKPLDGEVIELENEKGEMQQLTMDKEGKARVVLPFGTYKIHAQYLPYVHTITGEAKYERHIINLPMNWVGTKEMKRRAFVADSLARVAKEEMIKRWEALANNLDSFIKADWEIPMLSDTAVMKKMVLAKAKGYKAALAKNPKFFEEKRKTVLAVLNRMAPKIPSGIVVTDVTGSMYPYMEQVLVWHALNFMEGKTSKYVFFNDGDQKPDGSKVVGKTGGIYFSQGAFKDLATVIDGLVKAADAGGGGDAEENDMEAVLAAHNKGTKGTEPIILIADNFSPVRDIALLNKVKVPVHVILCGLDAPYVKSVCPYAKNMPRVNEEYIEIARKTGGSVHTIGEDIMDLSKKKEGETIVIDGTTYRLTNGRFEAATGL